MGYRARDAPRKRCDASMRSSTRSGRSRRRRATWTSAALARRHPSSITISSISNKCTNRRRLDHLLTAGGSTSTLGAEAATTLSATATRGMPATCQAPIVVQQARRRSRQKIPLKKQRFSRSFSRTFRHMHAAQGKKATTGKRPR